MRLTKKPFFNIGLLWVNLFWGCASNSSYPFDQDDVLAAQKLYGVEFNEAEIDTKIIWNYPADNEFLKERGEEFAIMLDLPFEYVAK